MGPTPPLRPYHEQPVLREGLTPMSPGRTSERPETWVTHRTGHMGNTFRPFWAGGVDAVESEFGDGGAPAVCRPAVGRRDDDGRMSGFRDIAEDRLQDL